MPKDYPDNIIQVFQIFFIVIGIWFMLWGGFLYSISSGSNDWPSVTGVILESDVQSRTGTGIRNRKSYYVDFLYEYVVDNKIYTGNEIEIGDYEISGSYSSMKSIVDSYPIGSNVTVYYDPTYPSTAALKVGYPSQMVSYLIGGLFFTTFSSYKLIKNRKKK